MDEFKLKQTAPYPYILDDLVKHIKYRPGWSFKLSNVDRGQGSVGLTLDIVTKGYDSYHPDRGENYGVHHYMIVPAASYNRDSWIRWLFEQILLVERHEACEFFKFEYVTPNQDGVEKLGYKHEIEHPYAPNHGPGWDPYIVTQLTSDTDRKTSFRGVIKEN